MVPKQLRALLGRTVEYNGQQYTVEHVRTTWRRVMPPIEEVALVHVSKPSKEPLYVIWVHMADVTLL